MIQGVTTGAGGSALGGHLADLKGQNETTRPGSARGLVGETTQDQIRELTQLAGASRAQKPIAHFHADPPADAAWGEREWNDHWTRLEREFGLERQPFAEAIHEKGGREHRHRVYSLYDEKTGCTLRLDHSYARLEKLSRLAEFETGHAFTQGRHNRAVVHSLRKDGRDDVAMAIEANGLTDGPRPSAKLTPQERHQEDRTKVSKGDVARATAHAWQVSDNAQAFMTALRENGLSLAMGEKVPVILDATGNTHSLSRMLAMSARQHGEPSPRASDIQARLAGVELPSLDDVRAQVAPVHDAAPVITPDPPQPGPGVPVVELVPSSQDVPSSPTATSTDGKNAPAHAHAHAGGTPKPKSNGGGGGGGASPSHDAPQSPLPSLDVGAGPGEPPAVNATPQQKAEYAAKLAAYEEKKTKAWQVWLRAWESQAKSKGNPKISGGGSSDVHDEKGCREAATALIRSIESAIERGAAIRAFNTALAEFTQSRRDPSREREIEGPAVERQDGGGAEFRGRWPAAGHDGPPCIGGAITDAGAHRRNGEHGGIARANRENSERNPLAHRAESLTIGRFAALSDMSRLRAAVENLNPVPDLFDGVGPKERKAKVQEFRQGLLVRYREDREVLRDGSRQDWRARMAAEKMRAHPLANELRTKWKHLTPSMREAGWQAIRDARESLVHEMKATAKANPPADFRSWLEFVSETDPKARCVFSEMVAAEERKAKIQSELSLGDARLDALKATAPTGERDEEKAAQDVKQRMKEEHAHREKLALEAREKATAAASRVRWWHWKSHPVRMSAGAAEKDAQTIEHATMIHTPSQTDFREAMETARSRARSNLRAFQAWQEGPKGKEVSALEKSLTGIRTALQGRDFYMRDAILTGGIDGALDEQRRREALEQKRREIELKKAEHGEKHEMGKVVQFPSSSGPRMR